MRIGVNIPDELLRRYEPLKSQVNISQLCREAIINRVEKYENAVENLAIEPTQSALNKVYEDEEAYRSIVERDWETLGYQNAVLWVQAADRKDWNGWHKLRAIRRERGRPEWEVEPPLFSAADGRLPCFDRLRLEYYQSNRSQSDAFYEWLDDQGWYVNWDIAHEQYGRSWSAYIDAAWKVICEWREQREQALRREREISRVNRPPPSVPDHFVEET
jgi:hypothetical protein